METSAKDKDWLSIDEAAAEIGVHPRTVRRYIRGGRLEVSRISSQVVRIHRSAIDAFMRSGLPGEAGAEVKADEPRNEGDDAEVMTKLPRARPAAPAVRAAPRAHVTRGSF